MAKKAVAIRVFQLAKELGVDSKAIIAKCKAEDIPDMENHMSQVSAGLAATIREWFSSSNAHTAVETAAAVDVEQARAKARKRPAKKGAASRAEDGDASSSDSSATAVAEPPVYVAPAPVAATTVEVPDVRATRTTTTTPRAKAAEPPPARITPAVTSQDDAMVEEPVARPAPTKAHKTHKVEPPTPAPVMNVPDRPAVVSPAGPMLQQPVRSKLTGPKVIRVETPDNLPTPRSRSTGPRTPTPVSRSGPRSGRGVGTRSPSEMPDSSSAGGRGQDRGGPVGAPGGRRNKRRSASATEEAGRTGRLSAAHNEEAERSFNWRQQDLLERENRLNRAGGFFKQARRDNIKRSTGLGHRATVPAEVGGKVQIQTPISIKELSSATGVKMTDIVKKLFLSGTMVTPNSVLDTETAMAAMQEYGIELEITETRSAEARISDQFKDRVMTDERRRSPVVTILGHVDHGKTSLLDKIRNANVAAGEAGGITQATSAFQVPVHVGDSSHMVTFIDTPGHEAFTEMRSRGAKVTDVVVLVVAADDGVMPQTVESINHAKDAGVPIVVALNKIDKAEATDSNIQRIFGQLAERELNPVEWGGTTEVIRTSATKGTGIQDLLEVLDYQAQLLDLKADYGGNAIGTVLEASMEEGRGAVAKVIVQQGTLKKGDYVAVGRSFGRVRDIVNDHGKRIDQASASMPVAISGLNDVPDGGDKMYVVNSLREAEDAAAERISQEREKSLSKEKITLDNIFKHLESTGKKELPLIVKADVQGSVETLRTVIGRITSPEIDVTIKHCAVGGVNESDVGLAEASGAIIVGFNVTSSGAARKLAEARGVDIRFYDVIYDLTDDVRKAAEGMLDPELKLEVLGHADVRDVFKISRVGMVAGCYVTDGAIERNSLIRVTRGGIVVEKDRRLEQLKRFKDDVKEVRAGQECGMKIDGYDDIKVGDVLECYKTREVARKL